MGHVVSTPETVGFLLIPRFSMIAFTAAWSRFGWPTTSADSNFIAGS